MCDKLSLDFVSKMWYIIGNETEKSMEMGKEESQSSCEQARPYGQRVSCASRGQGQRFFSPPQETQEAIVNNFCSTY